MEKFIGDAVMAVWGAPVAQEDDAERAVRAALDLIDAVTALGAEVGAPDLSARVGVLTGEAAVTLGAIDQGMVAGDLVNTASRIQSAAKPGQVLVGEATRRASEASVAYEDAGEHELKGKAEPVRLWRATRVVAGVGGAQKAERLEAPFVGRERELRTIKDLLHETIDEGKAHLVSIVGIAGIGKSRLAWELSKYIDGVQQTIRWHRGRCLSYGEGVTYWALAEMVRTRAGIAEGEDSASAYEKLRTAVMATLPDEEERRWVEPRLAQLLALEDRVATDRDDLFAAWRLFYERLADEMPTIMLFEDIQWADASLLDFIEYLMEWSKNYALFVVTLGRPELTDRRPTWGAGRRNYTPMFLEPLPEAAMDELLSGLAPGLPEPTQAAILERAEGIPLYAVETVRMLLDRGLLVERDGAYRPVGEIDTLAVPETLQALISARLDALASEERALVQELSVLGKTFMRDAAVGVSSLPEEAVDAGLTGLVRKEILSIQADRFSPERGQYGFLQDLVRKVAYDTLSKHDRKARHLTVAAYLEAEWSDDDAEIVEVVASHYVRAYEAAPEEVDATAIKEKARDTLARAGERAASLAASEEALGYYDQAIGLADDPLVKSELAERASRMAWAAGHPAAARAHAEAAMTGFESLGLSHPAARVLGWVGFLDWQGGHVDDAIGRMESALSVLSGDEPDEDVASLAAETARLHWFRGNRELSERRNEQALELAEAFRLPEALAHGLNTRALQLMARGRYGEARALLEKALEVSLDGKLSVPIGRSYQNLVSLLTYQDRWEESLKLLESAIEHARRVGDRQAEVAQGASTAAPLVALGRWDQALQCLADVPAADDTSLLTTVAIELSSLAPVLVHRGALDEARDLLGLLPGGHSSQDVQVRAVYLAAEAIVLRGEGRPDDALSSALGAWDLRDGLGLSGDVKEGLTLAIDLSLETGDLDRAELLLGEIEALRPGELYPYLQASGARFGARVAAARGHAEGPDAGFRAGARIFRETSMRFWLAVTLLEHAEWLVGLGRQAEAQPMLAEAEAIFSELGAVPWLVRLAGVQGEDAVADRSSSGIAP